ncbi:MAG: DUF2283 domain-containing protein [Deltaproteobacteria bacterium]|nr:DUF2283 domain-containing protein [Deltaproteobacteria bacterium]
MEIKYDKEVDALYIRFLKEKVYDSEEIAAGIVADYTRDNKIVGVEVLNASKQLEKMEGLKNLKIAG